MATRFYDRASIRKAQVLDNGFLKVPPSTLSRTGVQTYAPVGAKPFTVLRTAETVFEAASTESFALAPLTDDHPVGGVVNAENSKELAIGTIGTPFREGSHLKAEIMVTDATAIKKINDGKVQLSCGYWADLVEAPPGSKFTDETTGEVTPFDFFQVNIRGNHVALVHQGRAGDARLHLDAGDCVEISEREKPQMIKFTVDGIEVSVDSTVAALIAKERAASAALLGAVQGEKAKLKTTLDAVEAQRDASASQIKTLTEKVTALEDPKNITERINARVAIEKLAGEHGITADGMDLVAVKRAVIGKLDADIKLDGKSSDYVEAMFDALNRTPKSNPATVAASKAITSDVKSTPPMTSAEKAKAFSAAIFAADASTVKA